MPDYKDILVIPRERYAIIQLNRPEKLNGLSHNLRGELFAALRQLELEPSVRTIVIRGSGRAFCAGYDLTETWKFYGDPDYYDWMEELPNVGPTHAGQGMWPQHLVSSYWLIWELSKPVIAQVHGYCLAGGSELASMCDLMVIADDAIIGYPPVRAMTSADIIYHPWNMHQKKARELLYTGDGVVGTEAVALGWANYAVPVDKLCEVTEALAERIANVDPAILHMTKRQLNRTYEIMGIRTALSAAGDVQELSRVRPRTSTWAQVAAEQGIRGALDWRDKPFGDYRTDKSRPKPNPATW